MVWALVLMADFILEFRFEYLWPFWLLLRSVYDSFKYQGLVSIEICYYRPHTVVWGKVMFSVYLLRVGGGGRGPQTWDWIAPPPHLDLGLGALQSRPGTRPPPPGSGTRGPPTWTRGLRDPPPPTDLRLDKGTPHQTWDCIGTPPPPPPHTHTRNSEDGTAWVVYLWRSRWRSFLLHNSLSLNVHSHCVCVFLWSCRLIPVSVHWHNIKTSTQTQCKYDSTRVLHFVGGLSSSMILVFVEFSILATSCA